MTESPSEARSAAEIAERLAEAVSADRWSGDHGTAKIHVPRERWVEVHEALREELPFFSWLSAIDWSREVAVGDPPESEDVEERFEVLCRLSDVSQGAGVIVSADLPRDDASIESLTGLFEGAAWHEREAHEMFGIEFVGHPNLIKLYLPDGFEGNPLLKSFPLVSRSVKPWPGTVDVEDMPSTENLEGDGVGAE
jgi:NADH-quinone oxidoreductase subunit C